MSSFPITCQVVNGIGYLPPHPQGNRACSYDLIFGLADRYFFVAFSVFMVLLMLVEVLCLQEENCNLLEFVIGISSNAEEASVF